MRLTAVFAAVTAAFMAAAAVPPPVVTVLGRNSDISDITGIWETTSSGAILEISRRPGTRGRYDVRIIEAADCGTEPGTLAGTLSATAVPNTFDAEFDVAPAGTSGVMTSRKQHFTVEFDNRLRACTFRAYHKGKRVNLRRMLPYIFRLPSIENGNRPAGLDGAIRIDTNPTPAIL